MSTITLTLSPGQQYYRGLTKRSSTQKTEIVLTDASMAGAPQRISEAIASTDVKNKALEGIRQLSKTVATIRQLFEEVGNDLAVLDDAQLSLNGRTLQYGETWDSYLQEFEEIIQASHENAASASFRMQSYVSLLQEARRKSQDAFKDLDIELDSFLVRVNEEEAAAKDLSKDFNALAQKIKKFGKRVEREYKQVNGGMRGSLDSARVRLNELQSQLSHATEKVADPKWLEVAAIITALIGVAGGAAVTILTMSPMAATAIVAATVETVRDMIKKARQKRQTIKYQRDSEKEIIACQQEIAALEAIETFLADQENMVGLATERIAHVANNIVSISKVWHSLGVDIIKLREALRAAIGETRTETFFPVKMEAALNAYTALAELLDEYAKQQLDT